MLAVADKRSRVEPLLQVISRRQGEPDIYHTARLIARQHALDAVRAPVITTKVTIPALGAAQIARPRLSNRLNEGLDRALTLVVAPAGYGKTALLSAWAQHSPTPIAWLSLDAGDSAPYQFWAYLIAALDAARPGIGGHIHALLHRPDEPSEQALAALINALSRSEPLTLVLDNYQVIRRNCSVARGLAQAAGYWRAAR